MVHPVPHLTFNLKPGLSRAGRALVIRQLSAVEGVSGVSMIDADSPVPEIRNMGIIRLKPDAKPDRILTSLKSLGDSLEVSRAGERRLVGPAIPPPPSSARRKPKS